MIEKEIINKALSLIGKKMEDMNWIEWTHCSWECEHYEEFSYPKFYAYLLSDIFIARYSEEVETSYMTNDTDFELSREFGYAIYLHQSWDSSALIQLLEKI